jgi:hypothetical protein
MFQLGHSVGWLLRGRLSMWGKRLGLEARQAPYAGDQRLSKVTDGCRARPEARPGGARADTTSVDRTTIVDEAYTVYVSRRPKPARLVNYLYLTQDQARRAVPKVCGMKVVIFSDFWLSLPPVIASQVRGVG